MPPPINSSINRAQVSDSGKQSEGRVNEDRTSSSAQAWMLFTALRNVIIPLVQTALPNQKDLRQDPFGPEAQEFLVALQKYITSVVRDRSQSDSEAQVTRIVNLDELPPAMLSKAREEETPSKVAKVNHEGSPRSGAKIERIANLKDKIALIPRSLNHQGLHDSRDVLFQQALATLREHVFNTMPIRLLCFEKHGHNLNITLLDRTGIFSHLIPKLRNKFEFFFSGVEFGLQHGGYALTYSRWASEICQYTILSHTWLNSAPGEVTFSDWSHSDFDSSLGHPGYRKLVSFCKVAADKHEATLGWMDTVCINKESSTELDESIRSMYKWYQNAKNCIIYLAETTALSAMAKDPWFTRGWTLQELLAPRNIVFYGKEWTTLGNGLFNDKEDRGVQEQIISATTITPTELISPLPNTSISRKMKWAADRNVTRGEDKAYSLMGIFGVSISIAYGEGADLAFIRLVKEILNTAKSDVFDLFNWAGPHDTAISALIPSSSRAYLQRRAFDFGRTVLIEPLILTHLGLRIPVFLMPATPDRRGIPVAPKGDYYSTVDIHPLLSQHAVLKKSLRILDRSPFASPLSHEGAPLGVAFAVLNCGSSTEFDVILSKQCFAVAILYSYNNGIATPTGYKSKVPTRDPIVFQLNDQRRTSRDDWEYDTVPRSELARHGIQFLTMYL